MLFDSLFQVDSLEMVEDLVVVAALLLVGLALPSAQELVVWPSRHVPFAVAPTSSLLPLLGFRSTSGLPIGSSLAGSYDFPPGPNTVGGLEGCS